jgi:membrane-bound lytic murein transglycosylase B
MTLRRLTTSGHQTPFLGFGREALSFLLFFIIMGVIPLQARADWSPLIERLVRDGKDEKRVAELFAHPKTRFDPDPMRFKIQELIRYRFQGPSAEQSARMAAAYNRFLQYGPISRAYDYATENKATLKIIRERYGVPEEIIVAIMLVETNLGRNTGSRKAFNTLASMALAHDLDLIRPYLDNDLLTQPREDYARRRCREKSDWAYQELISLILYAWNNNMDPLEIPGSVYGAIGLCQFMPSNITSYGVDADGDGRIDLFTTEDALHSIGKFLKDHGWKHRMSPDNQYRVIMAYNRSPIYANTVLAVAKKIKSMADREELTAGQADRS